MENQNYTEAVHNAYTQCVEALERNKTQFLDNPEKDFSRKKKTHVFILCPLLRGDGRRSVAKRTAQIFRPVR